VDCSGDIGCRVYADAARAFNSRVSPWWSELHRVAKLRADRATGFKGTTARAGGEKQKRGLAHMHGVLSVSTPAELRWAEAYVDALADLAPSKGFGYVDRWEKIRKEDQAGHRRGGLPVGLLRERQRAEGVAHGKRARPGLPRLLVFIGCGLTARTGCTMRNLRLAHRLWASRLGLASKPDVSYTEWLAVAHVLDSRRRGP
jgi:hypothetical protein